MIAGKLPFKGDYEQALVYSILNETPEPLRDSRSGVPEMLEKICRRAMAKEAKDRYQTAAELITDLESYKAGAQLLKKTRNVLNKKRSFIYAGLVIILVALALIFDPFNLRIGIQKNIAEEKPSLAVISFENIPDPTDKEYLGEMLTNLLITALYETKNLDVVSRERLYDIQKDIGEGERKIISATTASAIARRASVTNMLLASILQIQPTLTVTYRVIDVQTGKIINTKRVSGYQSNKLFPLVDTLALMVKSDLNIAPPAFSQARSVMEVTTKSPEAYRHYVEGVELCRQMQIDRAKIVFQKAIDLDSTFAMVHYFLGVWFNDQTEIRKAWELRTNTTEKERLQIESLYMGTIGENPEKSVQIYEQLMQSYPHEQLVYLASALSYSRLCAYDRMNEVLERGLRSDSLDKILWGLLAYNLAGYNKRSEALQAADKYVQLAPAENNSYDSKGDVLLALGETDSVIKWWRKAFVFESPRSIMKAAYQCLLTSGYTTAMDYFREAIGKANEVGKAWAERETVLVSIHRGEILKAKRLLNGHLELHRGKKSLQTQLISSFPNIVGGGDLLYLVMLGYEEGNHEEMLRWARERSVEITKQQITNLSDQTNPICGRYEIAWALFKKGKKEESFRLLDDLKKEQRPGLPARQCEYEYFNAIFAFERGDYNIAVEQFNKSLGKLLPNHAPQYHYALALLKSGRVPDAILEFQRMTWWTPIDDGGSIWPSFSPMYNYWPIAAVKTHYWLGVAYEQQRKRKDAIKEYETFLDIWKDADFKSAEIKDAKVRLAKLQEIKK